jgi:site-specific recombinase XerD
MSQSQQTKAVTAAFDRYLTLEEERKLLRAIARVNDIHAERDHAWIRLLLATGIRLGALSKLTVGDARHAISSQTLELRPEIQKRGHAHSVPVNREAEKALRDLLNIRKRMGHHNEDLDATLVMGRKHAPLAPRSYQDRMSLWAKEAGLSKAVSPHWLRHTVAKRLLATTTHHNPLQVVQRALGHRQLSSTGIYTIPDKESVREAFEGMRR